jgi:hypothetical protein
MTRQKSQQHEDPSRALKEEALRGIDAAKTEVCWCMYVSRRVLMWTFGARR